MMFPEKVTQQIDEEKGPSRGQLMSRHVNIFKSLRRAQGDIIDLKKSTLKSSALRFLLNSLEKEFS